MTDKSVSSLFTHHEFVSATQSCHRAFFSPSVLLTSIPQTSLDGLRGWCSSRNTVFIGLDVEGCSRRIEEERYHSIGFASLAQPANGFSRKSPDSSSQASVDLGELMNQHKLDAFVLDSGSRRPHYPGPSHTGAYISVDVRNMQRNEYEHELVTKLLAIKEAYRDEATGQAPELVLVLFSWSIEFQAMTSLFPRIAPHLSRWVDVETLIEKKAGSPGPSLRELMVFLKLDVPRYLQSGRQHCPGMDAVRTLGVLIELLSTPHDRQPEPYFKPRGPSRGRRKKKRQPLQAPEPRGEATVTTIMSPDLEDDSDFGLSSLIPTVMRLGCRPWAIIFGLSVLGYWLWPIVLVWAIAF